MRNSHNITLPRSSSLPPTADEPTWSLPGAIVGFVAWLLALAIPFLLYGSNTLFFSSLYLALFSRPDAGLGGGGNCLAFAA